MNFVRLSFLLSLLVLMASCGSPSDETEVISDAELTETYIDSLYTSLGRSTLGGDSMMNVAEKALSLAEMIEYEKGARYAMLEKAKILSRNKDIEGSDVILTTLLELGDEDSLLYANANFFFGTNRLRQGKFSEVDSFMVVAERYAQSDSAFLFSIVINRASRQTMLKNYKDGRDKLQKAVPMLKFRPKTIDSANFYNMYGTCIAFSGEIPEGKSMMNKSLELFARANDSSSQGRVNIGLMGIEMMNGNFNGALGYLEDAIALHPSDGDTLLLAKYYKNEGLVNRELGRYDVALASYWKAHGLMELAGDEKGAIRTKISLGSMYELLEEPRASIACLQEAAEHPLIQESPITMATCKINTARLLLVTGDYDPALALCKESAILIGDKGDPLLRGRIVLLIGQTYLAREEMAEARSQFETILRQTESPGFEALIMDAHLALAELDQKEGNSESALDHVSTALEVMDAKSNQANLLKAQLIKAESNFSLGKPEVAIEAGTQAWEIALEQGNEPKKRKISSLLSTFHEAKGNLNEALSFARIHRDLEDAYNQVEKEKAIQELSTQMKVERKNAKISMLSDQNLIQTEKLNNRMLLITLLLVLAFGLVLFILLWQKRTRLVRKNELLLLNVRHAEDRLQLENEMVEMRLLALQARLNPHFVFNCLVVLQNLILRNDTQTALVYLRDFSRLTRMVFEISQKPTLSLSEEVEFLQLYAVLENKRLRSEVVFEVLMSPDIDPEEIQIPPLLLQPIIENCFKHGFADNRNGSKIELNFTLKPEGLLCTVQDNGKGVSGKEQKSRPSGIRITRKRLSILSGLQDEVRSLNLRPGLHGIGACVEFFIPMGHRHA